MALEIPAPEQHLSVQLYRQVPIRGDLSNHEWEEIRHPRVVELRERYQLLSVAGDGSEWQQILRLLDWVHHRSHHDGWAASKKRDALSLLKHAEKGGTLRCVEYGTLLAQVLCAVGIPARVVSLQRRNPEQGFGAGHVLTEVWSNDHGKWVVLDPQCNAYWTYLGEPQGALELRQHLLARQMWRVRRVVQPSTIAAEHPAGTPRLKIARALAMEKFGWARYFHHCFFGRNGRHYGNKEREPLPSFYHHTEFAWPPFEFQGGVPAPVEVVGDAHKINFTCNAANIQVHGRRPNSLFNPEFLVVLRHCTPWFATFEVRFDDGPWERVTGEQVPWTLHPGENRVAARTVNQLGRRGPASEIALVWNGEYGRPYAFPPSP